MFKNVASQKIGVYAFDSTTGLPKTGDAANITTYVSKDWGAVTVLGDASATELDATNCKGIYIFDLTQAETNADALQFSGKSTTANIVVNPVLIYTDPANFTKMLVDSNGRLDISAVLGTAQTAGDLAALAAAIKAKTDSLTFTVALQADVNVVDWKGAAAPAMTGDAFARLGAPVGASISADIATKLPITSYAAPLDAGGTRAAVGLSAANIDTQLAAINAKTTNLPADPADASDVLGSTNAIYNRIGAPVGASISADIAGITTGGGGLTAAQTRAALGIASPNIDAQLAAINALDTAVKAKTDNLPAAPAAVSSIPTANAVADALLDRVDAIETGFSVRSAFRIMLSTLAGKASGLATTTAVFRNVTDTKPRVIATVDGLGNRSAVSLDPS